MRHDRLDHLASVLAAVPPRLFNMSTFGVYDLPRGLPTYLRGVIDEHGPRPAVCCAWGHLAQTAEARAAGVTAEWSAETFGTHLYIDHAEGLLRDPALMGFNFYAYRAASAACRYFEVGQEAMERLFFAAGYAGPIANVTRERVIANVRQLQDLGEAEFVALPVERLAGWPDPNRVAFREASWLDGEWSFTPAPLPPPFQSEEALEEGVT